jgi:hypothetical protein
MRGAMGAVGNQVRAFAMAAGCACLWLLQPQPAAACCGVYLGKSDSPRYSTESVVALMRDGKRTVLSIQSNYQGPVEEFAWLIPVPNTLRPDLIKTLPNALFDRLDDAGAPRLIEQTEADPCGRVSTYGVADEDDLGPTASPWIELGKRETVEPTFAPSPYDIAILNRSEAADLVRWLSDHEYVLPEAAKAQLARYRSPATTFVPPACQARSDGAIRPSHSRSVAQKCRCFELSPNPTPPLQPQRRPHRVSRVSEIRQHANA